MRVLKIGIFTLKLICYFLLYIILWDQIPILEIINDFKSILNEIIWMFIYIFKEIKVLKYVQLRMNKLKSEILYLRSKLININ